MRQRMPGHRIGANRELAGSSMPDRGRARPASDKPGLVLSMAAYVGAICVIVWLVFTFFGASDDAGADGPEVVNVPEPAPTAASTVAPPSYVEGGDNFVPGDSDQTEEFWTSGPNPAIPPSQDPLTNPHY